MNLKSETLSILADNGKTADDIAWVGTTKFKIPTDSFWELADTEYDSGYGATEVAVDLLVVGDGWWLERDEYDGLEWWEFNTAPSEPNETRTVERLIIKYGWNTLEEMNMDKGEGRG